ncbi:MAG: HAMP domain-containing sensor histidine kinase [Devosia sp.]|nr:HAMP domain-containing sensor histidine kinase [Devosia sp.]
MRSGSIRLRLWSAAAISILLALAVAGVGLRYLFERHVERRVESELTVDLNQLIGATNIKDGVFQVTPVPTDPRFEAPLSGYYWQVEDLGTGALTRSRSLWDEALTLPPAATGDGSLHVHEIAGPQHSSLIAVARVIVDPVGRSFRATVAEDHQTIATAVGEYVTELAPAVLLIAVVLIAANFVQISVGLRPLESLRIAVHDVMARRRNRLSVAAPREVQPLADEIDRLLEAQEKALVRARSRATDLAHGLKTPLQVLASDIRTLRSKGETVLADEIERSTVAIRRHVERELARARLAPGISPRAECRVAAVARDVIDVVRRAPGGAALSFAVEVGDDITARIDPGDLAEILGNLVENAARFARSSVSVGGAQTGAATTITVVDDGPGIADGDKPAALTRGVGLDDTRSGTGLGLAIVADIVDAYGGRLELGDAGGGLSVTLTLPKG